MKTLTEHGGKRSQKRGIPPLIIDLLQRFGRKAYDHHGGIVRYLDRQARRRIAQEIGASVIRRLHEYWDAYIVQSVTDGAVITCGHRYRRIRHG